MSKLINILLISGWSFGLHHPLSAEPQDRQFYDAVRAEASGDLQLAASIYEEILLNHQSANLHANLGNVYFRLEDLGRAILHLRKSLLLNPGNRECRSSLAYALEITGLQGMPARSNPAFSADLQTIWACSLAILFWLGLLTLAWKIPWNFRASPFWGFGLVWMLSLLFIGWGWMKCHQQASLLNREVIVLSAPPNPSNPPQKIPLRRFAGEGSEHNTMLTSGTSLFIDNNGVGDAKMHQSPDGTKWYLARSLDGFNKGWLMEKEFRKLID